MRQWVLTRGLGLTNGCCNWHQPLIIVARWMFSANPGGWTWCVATSCARSPGHIPEHNRRVLLSLNASLLATLVVHLMRHEKHFRFQCDPASCSIAAAVGLRSSVERPVAITRSTLKTVFIKTTLVAHLVEQSGVEPKAAKAVLAELESAFLGSVHKKGSGEFTLPGLMKIGLQQVPAKKKRFGKDPFTGEER